jgi:DNA-binding transcriptional regulator YhcF (GntR family)
VTGRPVLSVDASDPTPPYEQLRRQFRDLIEAGVLGDGDRLPPLRQLAGDLGLAVGTVARTSRELEAAGLVASRRGGGTRVTHTPPGDDQERVRTLAGQAATFVRRTRPLGVTDQQILAAVSAALADQAGWPPGPGV